MKSTDDEARTPFDQIETVLTPGGRRPLKNVHMVKSSESLEPNAQSLHYSPIDLSPTASYEDFARPPGGRRHRSRIRRIRSGETFTFSHQLVERLRQRDLPGPPDAANWITYAGWMNATRSPITQLATTWTVPPAPVSAGTQLIYFFNGIEPADGQTIVQPVLQWGDSGADADGLNRTGQFWTVASWLVGGADNSATHTPHIRVNPGDVLIGLIKLVNQSPSGFTYTCEFDGLAGTTLPTPEIPELVWCIQTMEAYELQGDLNPPYDLASLNEYPATAAISFGGIRIVTNIANPVGGWVPQDVVTDYGEHTTVETDSTANGRVVVHL